MNRSIVSPGAVATVALGAVSVVGIVAFALPFIVSFAGSSGAGTRSIEASILLASIVGVSILVAASELTRGAMAGGVARSIALLGVLVAVDASLRLVPSFFGSSPIFALIILVGFVFGARFGFVMGGSTLLLSAVLTGGIGSWLPFQMLCAGWVGLTAGWIPHMHRQWVNIATVGVFGVVAGFGYGAVMNLYSWPFAAPGVESDVGLFWTPSLAMAEALGRYVKFYVTTSLAHDASRAAANAVLLLVAGPPVIRLLDRFRRRIEWTASDATAEAS